MSSELFDILSGRATDLVRTLIMDIRRDAPHYEAAGPEILGQRCRRLVEAFLASMAGGPAPFVTYVRQITEERISEGYYLPEMQQALSILESRAWQVAVERSTIVNLVPHLGIITGTIGAAKDELARVCLAHKQRADEDLERLQTKRLFAGTEGHVEPEAAFGGVR